jgi:hypothetical protein
MLAGIRAARFARTGLRLIQFGACPVVIGCALQSGGGVTQCLHLRVAGRQGVDLRQ